MHVQQQQQQQTHVTELPPGGLSLRPPAPPTPPVLSISLSLSCQRAASGGNKRKMKKNSKKKKKKLPTLPVAGWRHPPPAKLRCCCAASTQTHTEYFLHPVCLLREWETPPPTQTRALFLAGMLLLLLLACRWRSVHLCTCSGLSFPLSLCICALFAVPFCPVSPRVERSFLFYILFVFLNHLTRLPGGCNITTTTNNNSRDMG